MEYLQRRGHAFQSIIAISLTWKSLFFVVGLIDIDGIPLESASGLGSVDCTKERRRNAQAEHRSIHYARYFQRIPLPEL